MSMTFTKLFSSITESTIWSEPSDVRVVWITMMAMADRRGRVFASLPGLAHRARVDLETAVQAIEKFNNPDKFSRTPDFEGRRIEPIDGGWRLLNYERYRAIRDEEMVKESKRNHAAAKRAIQKVESGNGEVPVDSVESFKRFWDAYPKKRNIYEAQREFVQVQAKDKIEDILKALEWQVKSEDWSKENGKYVPSPERYLSSGAWMNQPSNGEPSGPVQAVDPEELKTFEGYIGKLFKRPDGARWTPEEKRLASVVVSTPGYKRDVQDLWEKWKHMKLPPQSVKALLSDWNKTIDQARSTKENLGF